MDGEPFVVPFKGDDTDLQNVTKRVRQNMKETQQSIGDVARELGVNFRDAVVRVGEALFSQIESAAKAGAAIDNLSTKTGLSTETVSVWGYALDQSGGSAESLGKIVTAMEKSMYAAGLQAESSADKQDSKLTKAWDKGSDAAKKLAAQIEDERATIYRLEADTTRHLASMSRSEALHQSLTGKVRNAADAQRQQQNQIRQAILAQERQSDVQSKAGSQIDQHKRKLADLIEKYQQQTGKLNDVKLALDNIEPEMKGVGKAYETLGLNIAELNKLSPDERLKKIALALASVPDPGTRAALAMKVFGKSGTDMLPIVQHGAEGVRRWATELERMGGVWSDEEANAAHEFEAAMKDLGTTFAGIAKQLFVTLGPSIRATVASIKEWGIWVKDLIRDHPVLVENLGKIALGLFGVGKAAGALSDPLQTTVMLFTGLARISAILGGGSAVVGAAGAAGAAGSAGAGAAAVGGAAAAGSLLAVAAAFAAVALAAAAVAPFIYADIKAYEQLHEANKQLAKSTESLNTMADKRIASLRKEGLDISDNALRYMDADQKIALSSKFKTDTVEENMRREITAWTGADATMAQINRGELARIGVMMDKRNAAFIATSNFTTEEIKDLSRLSESQKKAFSQYVALLNSGSRSTDEQTRDIRQFLMRLSLDHHESPSINDNVRQSLFGESGFLASINNLIEPMARILGNIKQMWIDVWDSIANYVQGAVDWMRKKMSSVLGGVGVKGFADGGTTPHSGVFDVGERGRERIFLPAGTRIMNAQDTARMDRQSMSGGTVNINAPLVNVARVDASNPADVRQLLRSIETALQSTFKSRGLRLGTT